MNRRKRVEESEERSRSNKESEEMWQDNKTGKRRETRALKKIKTNLG